MTPDTPVRDVELESPARLLARLRGRDTALWSNDAEVSAAIRQRLGWLEAVEFSRRQVDRIHRFAHRIRSEGFDHVILLGMGGSSLAPEVFNQCLAGATDRLNMTVLDTTFPDSIVRTRQRAEQGRALFIVSSKSGSTAETSAMYEYFRQWCRDRSGADWGDHFVAITDEGSALHQHAVKGGFREVFLNPADIGGRYSALSLFGLVPASLTGADLEKLLDRGQAMLDDDRSSVAAVELGMLIGRGALAGRDKLALAFSPGLKTLGLWIEQLVAESTGKQEVGVVPFFRKGVPPWPHFQDECALVYTRLTGDAPAASAAGNTRPDPDRDDRPMIEIELDEAHDLGAEFMRWQIATAIAASVMGINPFDEPDVNATKKATTLILRDGSQTNPSKLEAPPLDPAALQSFLQRIGEGDYLAILAYLPSDQGWEEVLEPLRERLQQRLDAVTCLALGPRYLHSSGQLHKGGRKNGHFLVLTASPGIDAPIPGEPYGFGILIGAQARGDIEVLRARGQNVLHMDLGPVDGAAEKLHVMEGLIAPSP